MNLNLTTAPALEPLFIDDVKKQLRIDVSQNEEDDYLQQLIYAARHYAERRTGRALITQSWTLKLPKFCEEIELPKPPLRSVTSITYKDSDGASQTLSSSVYQVDTASQPGRIKLAYGQIWPSVRENDYDSVAILFSAGYGGDPDSVPNEIRQAMLLLVAHWFENREPVNIGNITSALPFGVEAVLGMHDMRGFPS